MNGCSFKVNNSDRKFFKENNSWQENIFLFSHFLFEDPKFWNHSSAGELNACVQKLIL